MMLAVLLNVRHGPLNSPFKFVMSHRTISFYADGAGDRKTAVGVNKEFNRGIKFFSYDLSKTIDFGVSFVYI